MVGSVGSGHPHDAGAVDSRAKKTEVWKVKEKTGTEPYSAYETETQEDLMVKLEVNKMPKAETSFTNNEMGLQDTNVKPTQVSKQATVTLYSAKKTEDRDKESGPALYGLQEPIALKNSFQLLETNADSSL